MRITLPVVLASVGRGTLRGAIAGVALTVALRLLALAFGQALTLAPAYQAMLAHLVVGAVAGAVLGLVLGVAGPAVTALASRFGRELDWSRVEMPATLVVLGAAYCGVMTNLLAWRPFRVFLVGNTGVTLLYVAIWVGILAAIVLVWRQPEKGWRGLLAFAAACLWLSVPAVLAFWVLVGAGKMVAWRPSRIVEAAIWLVLIPLACGVAVVLERGVQAGLRRLRLRWVEPALVTTLLVLVPLAGLAVRADSRGTATGPSVLLVVMDSVRADAVLVEDAGHPTTPRLAEIAAEGTVFSKASSAAPWCLPATASLFSGAAPQRHGADADNLAGLSPDGRARAKDVRLLAEQFRDAGYRTGIFFGGQWLGPLTGMTSGFDDVHSMESWFPFLFEPRGLRTIVQQGAAMQPVASQRAADAAARWLRAGRGASFAVVHLSNTHHPYFAPAPFDTRYQTPGADPKVVSRARQAPLAYAAGGEALALAELDGLRGAYLGAVSHADEELGRLLDELRADGRLEETLVVVTSDHGENFGWGHLLSHFFAVNEGLLHVPLVVREHGKERVARVVDTPVSTLDVAPTILELCGVDAQGAAHDGVSLASVLAGGQAPVRGIASQASRPKFLLEALPFLSRAERSVDRSFVTWRVGDLKLVKSSDGSTALYDLAADPEELRNAKDDPTLSAQLAELEAGLAAWRAGLPPTAQPSEADLRAHRILAAQVGLPAAD